VLLGVLGLLVVVATRMRAHDAAEKVALSRV